MNKHDPKDPTTWKPFMHAGRMLYPIKHDGCRGCEADLRQNYLHPHCDDMPPCNGRVFKFESPEVIAEFTLQRLGVTNETQTQ